MTSNVGARLLSDKKSLGFSANTDKKQEENTKEIYEKAGVDLLIAD